MWCLQKYLWWVQEERSLLPLMPQQIWKSRFIQEQWHRRSSLWYTVLFQDKPWARAEEPMKQIERGKTVPSHIWWHPELLAASKLWSTAHCLHPSEVRPWCLCFPWVRSSKHPENDYLLSYCGHWMSKLLKRHSTDQIIRPPWASTGPCWYEDENSYQQ